MTETSEKKVWPNNQSDDALDWDFNTLKKWMVLDVVEAFIMGGSKGVSVAMHGVLTTAFAWHAAKRERDGAK